MHQAQNVVAGGQVIHQHAHGPHIEQLLEVHALALHFPPDAVNMLGTPFDHGRDTGLLQRRGQFVDECGNELLALDTLFRHQLHDLLVLPGLQHAESQVLQFPFQLPDTQAIGQWGMDQFRLPRQCQCRLAVHRGVAQQHQLPGKVDQYHADIFDQRQQQTAQALGAARRDREVLPGREMPQLVQFAQLLRGGGCNACVEFRQVAAELLRGQDHGAADRNGIRRQCLQNAQQLQQLFLSGLGQGSGLLQFLYHSDTRCGRGADGIPIALRPLLQCLGGIEGVIRTGFHPLC